MGEALNAVNGVGMKNADAGVRREDSTARRASDLSNIPCDAPSNACGFKQEFPFQRRVFGNQKGHPKVAFLVLAEREGFEPSIRLLTLYSLSRGAPSATRASPQNLNVRVSQ